MAVRIAEQAGVPGQHSPSLAERFGNWFFAVVAIVVFPLLPLLIEASKNNLEIKAENLLLTTAVLAAGFAFASESNLFRASYALLFLFAIGLNFHPEKQSHDYPIISPGPGNVAPVPSAEAVATHQDSWLFGHPGYFVIAVCFLQSIERMDWHIGKHRRFPDWLK